MDIGGAHYDAGSRTLVGVKKVRISRHEHLILMRLARQRGVLVPMAGLIASLWPDPDIEPELPEVAFRTHICRLRNKFEAAGVERNAIRVVWGEGYFLEY